MGPAVYIIAILGCGEGESACQQVAFANDRFQTVEACTIGADAALPRYQDLAFPVVVAQCQLEGASAAALSPRDVNLPMPEAAPKALPASYSKTTKRRG